LHHCQTYFLLSSQVIVFSYATCSLALDSAMARSGRMVVGITLCRVAWMFGMTCVSVGGDGVGSGCFGVVCWFHRRWVGAVHSYFFSSMTWAGGLIEVSRGVWHVVC